jgi:hypothetical protein
MLSGPSITVIFAFRVMPRVNAETSTSASTYRGSSRMQRHSEGAGSTNTFVSGGQRMGGRRVAGGRLARGRRLHRWRSEGAEDTTVDMVFNFMMWYVWPSFTGASLAVFW